MSFAQLRTVVFLHAQEIKIERPSVVRIILICLATVIGCWAIATFPIFWSVAVVNKVGAGIAAGEPFKPAALLALRPKLDYLERSTSSPPESLHNAALIELRLAELELDAGGKIGGSLQFARAQNTIESALRLVPSDAFMWFALFWLTKTRDGMSDAAIPYLRMSYLVGPHEGWVAVRRNRIAVPLLPTLPKDLAELVVTEFGDLVASGYTAPAAEIVTGPGWANQELLLKSLAKVPQDARQRLADAIYELGFDMAVPGVARRSKRPWD
jgi:hypothetical protein